MTDALASYLAEVEAGLRTAPTRNRRRILRELESHLLDEAEARGLASEAEIRAMLRDKEHPRELAREILASEDEGFRHRSGTKLLAGAVIGAATGGYMFIVLRHQPVIALAYGLAQGLLVAGGLFWLRRYWQLLPPGLRLLTATLFGTVLALPLGFTSASNVFAWTRLLYGGFTGFLAERLLRERRHSAVREAFTWLLENLAFTVLLYLVAVPLLKRIPWPDAEHFVRAMSFNLILQLGVWAALRLHRLLDERWVLSAKPL
jgi:Zn-dependent membrane protease YugP